MSSEDVEMFPLTY